MSLVGSGTLIVKPLSAKLTHDTEFLGKMDPYCKVTLRNQCKRTREILMQENILNGIIYLNLEE